MYVHKAVPLALIIISFLLLSPFLPQELIRDSAGWAGAVNAGSSSMWHPHHLIYMPIIGYYFRYFQRFAKLVML